MDLDSVLWLFLPVLAMMLLAILIKVSGPKASTRTRIIGIIVAVIVIVFGIVWRLTHGGF